MADIGKFIFTNEGRRMLVAQNGGIHFAVMGAILLTRGFDIDDDTEIKKVTWEDLKAGTYGTLGLKGIAYTSNGEGSEILTTDSNYASALENILSRESTNSATYLFDTTYQPDMGVKDKDDNVYGLYSFGFDKTKFNCNGSPVFRSIVLIGKQYVTDGDAKYNVEEAQTPTVVGILSTGTTGPEIARFDNGDDEESRNTFTEFKFEWRITVTENPIKDNIDIKQVNDLKAVNDRFQLTNDGLKTNANVKLTIGDREIQEFNLNKDGNIATSKAVLIANMVDTDTLDEQLNQPGMLHLINKHNTSKTSNDPLDPNSYRPQQILSTIKYNTNFDNPVNAYHVKTTLTADSDDKVVVEGSKRDNIPGSPSVLGSFYSEATYDVNAIYDIASHDNVAVNFFGLNNSAFDKSHAMFINSINNLDISNSEAKNGSNLYLASNDNTYYWSNSDEGPKFGRNVFLNSHQNYSNSQNCTFINAVDNTNNLYSNDNILIGTESLRSDYSDYNTDIRSVNPRLDNSWSNLIGYSYGCSILSGAYNTILQCTDSCIKYDTFSNKDTANKMLLNGIGLKGMNGSWQLIMGCNNATYHNYTRLESYVDEQQKWYLRNIDEDNCGKDPNENTDPVTSYIVIGAGRDDVLRRNALEFDLVADLTAYGNYGAGHGLYPEYDEDFDGQIGRLTTDWIVAPWIQSKFVETTLISTDIISARNMHTVGLTADFADITTLKTKNLSIDNKDISTYINNSVTNSFKNKTTDFGNAQFKLNGISANAISTTDLASTLILAQSAQILHLTATMDASLGLTTAHSLTVNHKLNAETVYDKSEMNVAGTYGDLNPCPATGSTAVYVSGTGDQPFIQLATTFPNVSNYSKVTVYNTTHSKLRVFIKDLIYTDLNKYSFMEVRKLNNLWYAQTNA